MICVDFLSENMIFVIFMPKMCQTPRENIKLTIKEAVKSYIKLQQQQRHNIDMSEMRIRHVMLKHTPII